MRMVWPGSAEFFKGASRIPRGARAVDGVTPTESFLNTCYLDVKCINQHVLRSSAKNDSNEAK